MSSASALEVRVCIGTPVMAGAFQRWYTPARDLVHHPCTSVRDILNCNTIRTSSVKESTVVFTDTTTGASLSLPQTAVRKASLSSQSRSMRRRPGGCSSGRYHKRVRPAAGPPLVSPSARVRRRPRLLLHRVSERGGGGSVDRRAGGIPLGEAGGTDEAAGTGPGRDAADFHQLPPVHTGTVVATLMSHMSPHCLVTEPTARCVSHGTLSGRLPNWFNKSYLATVTGNVT